MKEIMSNKNEFIKKLKKLQRKKHREENGQYLVEGFHLIEEAAKSLVDIQWVIVDQRGLKEWKQWLEEQDQTKMIFVSDEVMKSLSDLPAPQGIIGVLAIPKEIETLEQSGNWLALDNVQDPGNVGTMVRTADAAGYAGVIIGEGSADIYSTKVLRAMQGSHFHLPIVRGEISHYLQQFKAAGLPVYGTELNEQAIDYSILEPSESSLLIMGNEGQGVAKELLMETTQNVYIPIKGQAESLNVAVAAGILMYQLSI
ncbi:TrmH family RNA methyltransferase [Enterococcus sp. LJL128]|uniref:TrmH family RNA methyltransferase n=1 Tax=Enterococcus sp. LJL51 TaxID=3416656 RepID=UPI003CF10202